MLQGLDQRSKIEEVGGAPERLRCGTTQKELQRFRRSCKKNSPSVLSCIGIRGQEKAATATTKPGQPTADKKGKCQLPPYETKGIWRKREPWERSHPQVKQRVCPIPAMTGVSRLGTRAKHCKVLWPGEWVCQFTTRKSSATGYPPEAQHYMGGEESERPQISQKDFGWRNAGAWREGQGPTENQPGKETIENSMPSYGSDTTTCHTPVQGMQPKSRLSKTARRTSIFHRLPKHLHSQHLRRGDKAISPHDHSRCSKSSKKVRCSIGRPGSKLPPMKVVIMKFGDPKKSRQKKHICSGGLVWWAEGSPGGSPLLYEQHRTRGQPL